MPDVKTEPVPVNVIYDSRKEIVGEPAGTIKWFSEGDVIVAGFLFLCPCGCGSIGLVNVAGKGRPLWGWNKSLEAPTIHPSIRLSTGPRCLSHWHGWLRNGVWESC